MINVNDITGKLMYLAWIAFFLVKTVLSKYIGPDIQVRCMVIATAIYLFVKFYQDGRVIIHRINVPKVSLMIAPFVFFAILSFNWATIVTAGSKAINNQIRQNFIILVCMEIFWGNNEKIIDLLKVYIFSMFIYGTVATFSTPIGSWGSEYTYGGFTAVHRNAASVIFVVCFGVSYYLYEIYREKKYLALAGIFLFYNLVTGARKGIIQTVFIIAMVVLLQNELQKKIRLISGIVVLLSILGVIFMNSPFLQETYGARLLAVFDDSIADGSRDFRKLYRIWAILGFLERPIIGHGSGYTAVLINKFTGDSVYSHCNYTEMLCNYGLIGFTLNYLIYIRSVIHGFKNRKNSMGRMVMIMVLSIFIIEYGQVTYVIMSGILPLYILFLAGMYGVEALELNRKEV